MRHRCRAHSGCLSSASSVTGGRPFSAASAVSRAKTPAGVSASASPPESSTGTSQRSSAASTRRASARSGVTSAAVVVRLVSAPRAAPRRWPAPPPRHWRPRSRQTLRARRWRELRNRHPSAAAATVRSWRRAAMLPTPCARGHARSGGARVITLVANGAHLLQQRRHGELRMAVRRVSLAIAACDHFPGRVVQLGVEAGQHQRAMRQFRDGREQRRRRRHRTGGAGGDHRPRAGRKTLRLRCDQQVAAFRRLDAALFIQKGRPRLARDFQETAASSASTCPYQRGTRSSSRSPRHLPRRHVIHQPREIVGERQRRGGLLATSGELPSPRGSGRRRPFQDQLRQQHAALESGRSRRADRAHAAVSPMAASAKANSSSSTSPIGTMRGRIAASRSSTSRKTLRQPAGAPRRQIDRRAGERQRIAPAVKPSHQPSVRSTRSISVGRNGADAGMVKTRGSGPMALALCHCPPVRAMRESTESPQISAAVDKASRASAHARRDRGFGLLDRLRRADMHPEAFEAQAHAAGPAAARSNSAVERKSPGGRILEQCGRKQSPRRHRRTGATSRSPRRRSRPSGAMREIAAAVIADAGRGRRQQQQRVHRGGIERLGKPVEIGLHAVDPERVGVDVEERLRRRACGSALTTPPPVSSSRSRSSEITICGRWCGRRDGLRSGRRGNAR